MEERMEQERKERKDREEREEQEWERKRTERKEKEEKEKQERKEREEMERKERKDREEREEQERETRRTERKEKWEREHKERERERKERREREEREEVERKARWESCRMRWDEVWQSGDRSVKEIFDKSRGYVINDNELHVNDVDCVLSVEDGIEVDCDNRENINAHDNSDVLCLSDIENGLSAKMLQCVDNNQSQIENVESSDNFELNQNHYLRDDIVITSECLCVEREVSGNANDQREAFGPQNNNDCSFLPFSTAVDGGLLANNLNNVTTVCGANGMNVVVEVGVIADDTGGKLEELETVKSDCELICISVDALVTQRIIDKRCCETRDDICKCDDVMMCVKCEECDLNLLHCELDDFGVEDSLQDSDKQETNDCLVDVGCYGNDQYELMETDVSSAECLLDTVWVKVAGKPDDGSRTRAEDRGTDGGEYGCFVEEDLGNVESGLRFDLCEFGRWRFWSVGLVGLVFNPGIYRKGQRPYTAGQLDSGWDCATHA